MSSSLSDHDHTAAPLERHDSGNITKKATASSVDLHEDIEHGEGPIGALPIPPGDKRRGGLHRALSARQVTMIALAGTIGTGLFLGTGR